jgi:hypothetical protein
MAWCAATREFEDPDLLEYRGARVMGLAAEPGQAAGVMAILLRARVQEPGRNDPHSTALLCLS